MNAADGQTAGKQKPTKRNVTFRTNEPVETTSSPGGEHGGGEGKEIYAFRKSYQMPAAPRKGAELSDRYLETTVFHDIPGRLPTLNLC